jgi:ATP-binding cassette subfamily F protein uup
MPLLSLQDVSIAFGGDPLFEGVEIHIEKGDRICLVGRNGCGKSTLLKVLTGQIKADTGTRVLQPGLRIAYLPQVPDLAGYANVRAYVEAVIPPEHAGEDWRIDAALSGVNLPGERAVETLSGGESRRAALARLIVSEPEVVLLDEPTNHLDLPTIEWLENTLANHNAALVMVSHDRAFLGRLTRTTLWLDRGTLHRTEKGFQHYEAWSEGLLADEAMQRRKLDKRIAEETQWSREGISARRTRNQGRLRRLHALRAERGQQRKRQGSAKLVAETGQKSGKIVIDAKGLTKGFAGRTLIDGFDTTIMRGDRVGIIGPNGAGKSTLLKMLIGELAPDAGTIRHGTNLTPVYVDQNRARLDESKSLQETLCMPGTDRVMVHGEPKHVAGYLRDFLFEGRDARRAVSSLSGGERARLLLARDLAKPSNLLILDEPTNDLDLETLDLLQDVLGDYAGTLILVSHDRDFLDRIVTSTIGWERDGVWIEYAGGYSDYLEQRPKPSKKAGRAKKAAPTKMVPEAVVQAGRKRLNYKQQKAYDALPGQIESFNTQITELEAQLNDGGFYSRDPKGFRRTSAKLDHVRKSLATAEEEWLELEMMQEG